MKHRVHEQADRARRRERAQRRRHERGLRQRRHGTSRQADVAAAPTSPATSTITPPAPTARSRCRSWSRSRPTRATRPGASTGSCRPAMAATAIAIARWPKTPRSRRRPIRSCIATDGTTLQGPNTTLAEHAIPPINPEGPRVGQRAEPGHVALAVDAGIPVSDHRVSRGAQEHAGVHRPGIGRRRPRAHSMSVIAGQLPASIYKQKLPTSAGLLAARQCHRARQVVVLLRSRRHRHQPRQHRRSAAPSATTGIARCTGSANAADPSWNAIGAEADAGRRRGQRRCAATRRPSKR